MRRLVLLVAAAVALAGCGSAHHRVNAAPKPAPKHYPVVVRSPRVTRLNVTPLPGRRIDSFAQLLSPTRLRIVTTGSSSCPSVPDELVVLTPHRIRIHLAIGTWDGGRLVAHPPPSGVCTTDFGTTQMMVAIDPKLIDVHRPLTVLFLYHGTTQPLVRIAAPLNG